jgi:hypothetical protein
MHLARHLVAAPAHLQPTAKAGVALATQSAASVLNPGGMTIAKCRLSCLPFQLPPGERSSAIRPRG